MSYILFIDDERFPVSSENTVLVRSVEGAINHIKAHGPPVMILFDHDLGDGVPTGFDLAKWLVEKDLDLSGKYLPPNFSYEIHSQNPVGKKNIQGLLDSYLSHKERCRKRYSPSMVK